MKASVPSKFNESSLSRGAEERRRTKRAGRKKKDGADKDAAASDLGDSIISDSEPGIADKRQLNLNHEYERSERGRECTRGRKGTSDDR